MAGKYVKVNRTETLTFWESLYVPEIIRGLSITARHFAWNFVGVFWAYFTGNASKRRIMTVYYPEEKVVTPPAYRGRPVLVIGKDGREKCVACGLCEAACPPECISIVGGMRGDGTKYPVSYLLDGAKCIFCGLCEEACPEEAIVMSDQYENLADYDRKMMVYGKDQLLVPEDRLGKRLDYIRERMFGKCNY
ncbi:MAG: NADH-quinone oxidoreductase subunit I [Nitrospinota bacterium]